MKKLEVLRYQTILLIEILLQNLVKITKDFGNVQFAPEFKNGYIITTTNGES